MDPKEIKEWVKLMERLKLKRMRFREKNGKEIDLERETPVGAHYESIPHPVTSEAPLKVSETTMTSPKEAAKGDFITSPMVGTFYLTPAPSEPNFVQVGDTVAADTIVCIVEAMKVMNEVKAGKAGVIKEVLMENQHAVEFGTKLFRIG